MDCEWVQERLPELLTGKLPMQEEQQVLGHLAQCADCRAELAFWARVSAAVREDAPQPDAALLNGVREALFPRAPLTPWEKLRETHEVCRMAFKLAGAVLS